MTPSLLIALYESIPPFQRVPFVDATTTGFGARLRNMKLLVGSIASGRYGLLTKDMREKLEELDLRKFCEKDADSVRDAIEIIVQIGERGRAAVAESETPKKSKKTEMAKTPRLKSRTGRIAGNDLERTPTPRKRRPVLVLPAAIKMDYSESSADEKDSGWDGSTLGVLSQIGQDDHKQDGTASTSDRLGMIKSDQLDPKSRKPSRTRSSPQTPSSPSSCSPMSSGFLVHLAAGVNDRSPRSPAPPPYSEEDRTDETDEEDNFETPRQQPVAHRIDLTPKPTPVKRLFAERIRQRDTKIDHFGDELLSSHEKTCGRESALRGQNGVIDSAGKEIRRDQALKDEGDKDEEKSQCTWITVDESGAESRRSFPSPAKERVLSNDSKKPFTPKRAIKWDADGAAYVPLPLSRPTSPSSAPCSKTVGDLPSKTPLLFPPSLLRTMHWATSLPTPPLSPKTQRAQKLHPQSAIATHPLITPSRIPKPRKMVTTAPLPPIVNKRRSSNKRNNIDGPPATLRRVSGKSDLVVEVPEDDDRDEWVSIDSPELSSRKASEQSQYPKPPRDDSDQMPLSFATTLVQTESDELATNKYYRKIYSDDKDTGEIDNDSDDRTTLYSVSTVSWGDDDPFTAALRLKRQIASEKLKEVERSFSAEVERKRVSALEFSTPDRLRWRVSEENEMTEEETDSDGGLTDVEEELRVLEEIGRKESIRQGLLLQKLRERGP